jgi:transcriptional regulator
MSEHPFAHFVTVSDGLHSTRIPMLADLVDGRPAVLRGHLNAHNPQAQGLDVCEALVTFDGPASYVSPHWRTEATRAATFDYEEVQLRGRVRVIDDIAWFRRLVDEMAALIEPRYAELGEYPVWTTGQAPAGYVERLFPAICGFEVEVSAVRMISKLHQSFPEADRRSVADHLSRARQEQSRAVAAKIRATLD